ncbi:hypothetical protein LTR85_004843 [Meristemomyces frigidus]|nr:hypothetical protein LTR85_004843 [Meristemomyces frigidus]
MTLLKRVQIEVAFERFKATVSSTDARQFETTLLSDVHDAAKELERKLATRQSSRNRRRILPLLEGLGHYSSVVEVLCNGTPYLPWIWAPIKLFLQIATEYVGAVGNLVGAYGAIADALPRFDRLSTALRGKSVLCAQLTRKLQSDGKSAHAFYICSFQTPTANSCSQMLMALAAQLITQKPELSAYVYDEYILKGQPPSKASLKQLIPCLISAFTTTHIVIDGLDEASEQEQKDMLAVLLSFVVRKDATSGCKVAIFSRDTPLICKVVKQHPVVSLRDESAAVDSSIRLYVHDEMLILRDGLDVACVPEQVFDDIEQKLVSKADGMFLWVRLMLTTLRDLHSVHDLLAAVESLPSGLDEAYGRLLQHIRADSPRGNLQKARAIFSWIACAARPLKVYELLDALAFCTHPYVLSDHTKLAAQQLDRCKPLIEVDRYGCVCFVHASVKEYLKDLSSGPLLALEPALYQTALGCMAYMRSSLALVDTSIPEHELVLSIAKGQHGLHDYAQATWLDHMLGLANSRGGLSNNQEDPLSLLIIEAHGCYTRLSAPANLMGFDLVPSSRQDSQLVILERFPALHDLARTVRAAERTARRRKNNDGSNSSMDIGTGSLFERASGRYHAFVQSLVSSDAERLYPHIDAACLARFRGTYGGAAFPCRHHDCPRRWVGYPSAAERDDHERAHAAKISCQEPSCEYPFNFRTPDQLRKHAQSFHQAGESIPQFGKVTTLPPPAHRGTPQEDMPMIPSPRSGHDDTASAGAPFVPASSLSHFIYDKNSTVPRVGQMAKQMDLPKDWLMEQQKHMLRSGIALTDGDLLGRVHDEDMQAFRHQFPEAAGESDYWVRTAISSRKLDMLREEMLSVEAKKKAALAN